MGLDMYITRKKKVPTEEIQYWRKEPAIHAWFKDLAIAKNISFDEFNCVPVTIDKQDIEELIDNVVNDNLDYEASGFFFGSNSMSDKELIEWKKWILSDLNKILKEWDDDYVYTYDSWW